MMFLLANPPEIILWLGDFLNAYSPVREATKNENVLKQVEVFNNNCFDWKSYGSERFSSHVSPMFHWCEKCHFPRLWRRWNTWTYHRRWCTTMPWHCWWWSEWWLALKILKQSLRHRWIVWIEAKNSGSAVVTSVTSVTCIPQGHVWAGPTIGRKQTLGRGDRDFRMEFDHDSWWFRPWGCNWVDLLGNLSPNKPHKLGYGARTMGKKTRKWVTYTSKQAGIARLVCWFMLIRCSEFWYDK